MGLESVISTPVAPPPPKAAPPASASNSSSTGSPSGSSSSQASAGSQSSGANRNSANSASRTAAATSGKSGNSASNTANTQGKNSAASSQANQGGSSAQTQSTAAGAAASAKNGATQSGTTTGPSFIEALAQSQASAADSATAATTATANATADGIAGGGGKGKTAKEDDTDPTAASFGFLSQSLVAAMGGGQQPNAGQATTTGDSSDGVSLASGSTIASVVANLTSGTADALDGATAGDGKAAGSATGASAADGSASGTGAFQAQMGVSSHFQANATANTQMTNDKVSSPVGTTAFNEEVGGKVTWMASQRVQSASLQVSPEHMGPVEVRISVQDGATSVAFSANHADTRAALEQSLPRLREMFATQGLTLSDASVSQQSPRGQSQKQAVAAIGAIGGTSTDDDSTSSVAAVSSARLGLVDTYA